MQVKPIPGTLGFTAREDGKIFDPDGKERGTYRNSDGYVTVSVLTEEGIWVTFGVHRLVALAFHLGEQGFERNQVNHRDGELENNHASNLEWVTARENNIHAALICRDNRTPRLIVHYADKPSELALNLWDASYLSGVAPLEIWDCIKENRSTASGVRFVHLPWDGLIPEDLKKNTIPARDEQGRARQTPLKTMDLDTGEIKAFSSFAEAGNYYGVSSSHLYQSIPKSRWDIRVFKKKYLVAYLAEDFPEYNPEKLALARGRGPRDVVAYNVENGQQVITKTAKEAIQLLGLSKKAVTTALAKGQLRVIEGWVLVYLTEPNLKRLKTFVESPVST